MKSIIKIFVLIPVFISILVGLFSLLFGLGLVYVERLINNEKVSLIVNLTNSCLWKIVTYMIIYKVIIKKLNYERINLKDMNIPNYGLTGFVNHSNENLIYLGKIIVLLFISALIETFLSKFFSSKFHLALAKTTYWNLLSATFIPAIFEEIIFRNIFFRYCEDNKIERIVLLNIICFSFCHIIPTFSIIVLGIILAYTYKKYHSIIINMLLHFFYNTVVIILAINTFNK